MRYACTLVALLGFVVACRKDSNNHEAPAREGRSSRPTTTEASLFLSKLSKNAKMAALTNASFPVGTTPWTPASACCSQAGHKCQPNSANWSGIWSDLDFTIDEPSEFQYSYESDGKAFTAKAVGDPECTGAAVTYKISGRLEGTDVVIGSVTQE